MSSHKENNDYLKWKADYQKNRKSEKIKGIVKNSIIILTTVLFFFLGKFIYHGKYKFLGQQTANIEASIYRVGWWHWGKDIYKEKIYFNYKFQNITYNGYARIGSLGSKGHHTKEIDDIIILKISTSKPENYEFIK